MTGWADESEAVGSLLKNNSAGEVDDAAGSKACSMRSVTGGMPSSVRVYSNASTGQSAEAYGGQQRGVNARSAGRITAE